MQMMQISKVLKNLEKFITFQTFTLEKLFEQNMIAKLYLSTLERYFRHPPPGMKKYTFIP